MKKFLALALYSVLSIGGTATAFAGTDDAYFFGDSEFRTEMDNVEYNIDRMEYYTKIYTDPNISQFSTSRLNSSVLYFAGHGSKYTLNTKNNCDNVRMVERVIRM